MIRLVLSAVCLLAFTGHALGQFSPNSITPYSAKESRPTKQPPRSSTSVAKRKTPRPPARKIDAARERATKALPSAAFTHRAIQHADGSNQQTSNGEPDATITASDRLSEIGKRPIASSSLNPLNPYAYATNADDDLANPTPESTLPAPRLNPRITTSLPYGYRATRNSSKSTTGHATSFGSGSPRISPPQTRVTLQMPPPPRRRGISRVGGSSGGG